MYTLEEAADIATQRQAYEGGAAAQALPTVVRQLNSVTGTVTEGTRAERGSAVGMADGDLFRETDTGWVYRFNSLAWKFFAGVGFGSNAARTAITPVSADDDGAAFVVTDTGTNNGVWRITGGAWAQVLPLATLTVATSFRVGTNDVVKARGAAVADVASADATDLATAITLANETKAQLNAWLARARAATGHGLIS